MKFWLVRLLSVAAAFAFAFAMQGLGSVIGDDYAYRVINVSGIFITLAVSLNLINGITGQFSIGHAAFYQVGAYVTGYMTLKMFDPGGMHPTLWLINSGPRKALQIWVPYWHWTSATLAAIKTALIEPLIQSVKLKKLHPLDYEEINSLQKKIQSAPPQSMNLKWQDGIISNYNKALDILG